MTHLSGVWFKVTSLEVASGHGCRVTTVDGTEYLDFAAGIAVNSTGHSHPRGRGGDRRAGGPGHPPAGERLHPRPPRAARGAARRADAGRHRHVLLRQLRRRDHGGRGQAGQAGHGPAERRRVRRVVPRADPPDDGDDDVEDRLPRRSQPAAGRRLRGAVPRPAGAGPGGRGAAGAARARPPAGVDDRAGRDGGDDHGARARRGRLLPGAAGVPARRGRALPGPRDPLRRRRGAVGLRAHRPDVRRGARRRRARRHLHGQGDRLGLPAVRPRHAPRARRPVADGQPRRHLRRQPDRLRGGAGDDRRAHGTGLPRPRRGARASSCRPACASCNGTTRASARCAASA